MPGQVRQRDIAAGLRSLGLGPGAGVMVHSSLRSFGYVVGGARAVIAALMEVLTPEGTLLMPSFNHGRIIAEGRPGCFDPAETPTSNGAIPDLFWRLPGVRRSWHPTHSFAAWGRHAERYVKLHHRTLTTGPESPLGLLWADGGYGLLLGVDYRANTFHHVVEVCVGARCLGPRGVAHPMRLPDGRVVEGRTWAWRAGPCPLTSGNAYAVDMEARGLHRQARIGECQATLFRLNDCFDVIAQALRQGKGDHPPCTRCPIRPARSPHDAPSDWDAVNARLKPDSPALRY